MVELLSESNPAYDPARAPSSPAIADNLELSTVRTPRRADQAASGRPATNRPCQTESLRDLAATANQRKSSTGRDCLLKTLSCRCREPSQAEVLLHSANDFFNILKAMLSSHLVS